MPGPVSAWCYLRLEKQPLKVADLPRCMQLRLSSLHAEAAGARTGHMPQRWEQAIAMAALACFIAHLTAGVPSD